MNRQWQDTATRVVFVVAGVIAAALFVVRGDAEALPALAAGGALGACLVRRSDEDD